MQRIFWIRCPECNGRFFCDYELRHAGYKLECPFCQRQFLPDEGRDIDERWFS
jgi:hypothetical protein